ncbi:MAG: hypothetical protein RSF33_00170 [Hydrogenoanaerobacterium sp.]
MKKNSFLTFCFAFIPGAGQMYLGMMKRGVSIMLAFAVITAVASFLNLPIISVVLPVIWFFSFFDTFNIKGMSYDELMAHPDAFLFCLDDIAKKDWQNILGKRHMLTGWCCVAFGLYILFNTFGREFLYRFDNLMPWIRDIFNIVPTLVVAIIILILGVYLVKGGKKQKATPNADEDFTQYGGKKNE